MEKIFNTRVNKQMENWKKKVAREKITYIVGCKTIRDSARKWSEAHARFNPCDACKTLDKSLGIYGD